MTTPRFSLHALLSRYGRARLFLCAAAALVALLLLLFRMMPGDDAAPSPTPAMHQEQGPPWRTSPVDARFILVLYADLECPFCKAYYPTLKAWIARQSDVSLEWHHLPLPAHEPAATVLASLTECVGETAGHAGFFEAIGWLYRHTRSDGQGLPDGLHYPDMTPAVQACLDSGRPQTLVRSQAEEGAHAGITATPSLRLIDRRTGESLLLQGPVEGDALLSAMDMLAADARTVSPTTGMPADVVGDMPR